MSQPRVTTLPSAQCRGGSDAPFAVLQLFGHSIGEFGLGEGFPQKGSVPNAGLRGDMAVFSISRDEQDGS